MSYKAWNTINDFVTMPDATDGTDSKPFSAPKDVKAMRVHIPALVGTATTIKLQALDPEVGDGEDESWGDVTVFDVADGSFEPIDALPESTVVVLPASITGGGVFRWVASAAQTGAIDAITIKVVWLL